MKVTCDVIKDLLPLYLEDLASEDSRKLIEGHIETCTNCKVELESMKEFKEIPMDTNIGPLKKIERKLLKDKVQTIVFTGLLVLAFAILGMAYITAPEYLPYSEDIMSIKGYEDGKVIITFREEVAGYDINRYGDSYSLTAWSSLWNKYIQKNDKRSIVLNPEGEEVKSIYYYTTDGEEDILIYGIDPNPGGGQRTLPRLVLGYYLILSILLTVLSGFFLSMFRKNERIRNILEKVFLLPLSYSISHVFIKGFTGVSYSAQRDLSGILLLIIPIYSLLIIGIRVYKRYRVNRKQKI